MTSATGEVFDLGYKRYDGPREGRMRSRQALWVNGVRTALGLGRGWQSKVLPGFLVVAVIVPALLFSFIASRAQQIQDIPTQADYFRVVNIVVLLFSATTAPEILCPDRRDRVLDLYLVRPLTTTDYVVGRWLAFFSVMLPFVYAGQLVFFIGLTLAANHPFDYLRDQWLDVPRLLVVGAAIAAFGTSIPLAISTFTIRRTYAAAIVIAIFLVTPFIAGSLTFCQNQDNSPAAIQQCDPATGAAAKWVALVSLPEVPLHVGDRVFNETGDSHVAELVHELNPVVPVSWFLILVIGPGAVLWWQYWRMRP